MTISNPEGLWIKPFSKKRISNEHGWAELKIKYDSESDLTTGYFDLLVGRKNVDSAKQGKPYIQVHRTLSGRIINFQDRRKIQSVTEKVESKTQGKLSEETLILKTNPPKLPVDVVLTYNGKTKEVSVADFKFKNSVIFD